MGALLYSFALSRHLLAQQSYRPITTQAQEYRPDSDPISICFTVSPVMLSPEHQPTLSIIYIFPDDELSMVRGCIL